MTGRKTLLEEVKGSIRLQVEKAATVAVTTDYWSSSALDAYLAVTCHFISVPKWKLHSYLLQSSHVTERHTAANTAEELKTVAQEWDLNVAAATTDNVRNMVGAIRLLKWRHIPCLGHTLQIAVKADLSIPAVAEVLGQARKVVIHFKHSLITSTAL